MSWNDCWFLAALVGLAFKRPYELLAMVDHLCDGWYRVMLPGRTVQVVGPDEAGGGAQSGPWPWGRVCEVAAARFEKLNDSRVSSFGLGISLLTGRSWTRLTNLTKGGFAPWNLFTSRPECLKWFKGLLQQKAGNRLMVLGGTDGDWREPVYPWIAPQHCYALLGYDQAADRVRVRDPRGVNENVPGRPIPADRLEGDHGPGVFWLTAAETEDSFCGLAVEDD